MQTDASIILLTFNGELYLAEVLEMIHRQKVRPRELIAIDSGSTDGTLQILRKNSVQLHEIPNSEFSHPGTRNIGARMAQGKYVIFLTQDATPADSCWLEQLLKPFQEYPRVAGTFSRQVPRPRADLLEANDVTVSFKLQRNLKTKPGDSQTFKKKIWGLIQFSNSSSACDRELLLANPFDENLRMGEDQEWAKRMLEAGNSIVYEPTSVVLHSHQHNLKQKFQRSSDMGTSFSRFLSPILGKRRFPLGAWMVHLLMDLKFIPFSGASIGKKLKWLGLSPLHRAAIHYAYWRGWNSAVHHDSDTTASTR